MCVASKPFEFRIQCGVQQIFFDVFRLSFTFWTCYYCLLVPFLYFYAMVHLFYSIRFFIYYFFFSFLFFFLSETRSFPSGIRFGRQRDDDDTHSRKSQTQTHTYIYTQTARCALENILLLAVFVKINILLCRKCTTDWISALLGCEARVEVFFFFFRFLFFFGFTMSAYSKNVFICSRSLCISYSKQL